MLKLRLVQKQSDHGSKGEQFGGEVRTGGEYLEQDCTKLKWTTLNPAQVVCDDVLRNKSMKPSHLKRHLTADKPKRQTS